METYVGRDPEIMVTHEEDDRAFHPGGQMVAKDLFWAIVVLIRGKMTTSGPKSGEVNEKLRKVIPWIFWSNSQFGPTGQARIYN